MSSLERKAVGSSIQLHSFKKKIPRSQSGFEAVRREEELINSPYISMDDPFSCIRLKLL